MALQDLRLRHSAFVCVCDHLWIAPPHRILGNLSSGCPFCAPSSSRICDKVDCHCSWRTVASVCEELRERGIAASSKSKTSAQRLLRGSVLPGAWWTCLECCLCVKGGAAWGEGGISTHPANPSSSQRVGGYAVVGDDRRIRLP